MLAKRVTSGGPYLRELTPVQHSSEEPLKRWRAVEKALFDLTGLRIERKAGAPIAMSWTATLTGKLNLTLCRIKSVSVMKLFVFQK